MVCNSDTCHTRQVNPGSIFAWTLTVTFFSLVSGSLCSDKESNLKSCNNLSLCHVLLKTPFNQILNHFDLIPGDILYKPC